MKDQERVPLRVVLRNFLNHIENLESQSCPEKSYEAEFQDLKIFSENVKSLKEYSCLEGEKEVNRKKNRYKDILPFDVSRVVLNEYAGIPGSDYINANFIKGASGSPAYIASQGPLPSTVNDFWRMVVQCEVQVIVMACNEEEAGKAKCEKYWVDDGEEKQFGMISVKLLKSSTVCPDFSVRTMRLKYSNNQSVIEERTVCQLHYVAWPDHGVPTVVQPLLDMVRLVRDTQASETLPVLVHCSAGCGRTGTICAIDYVWGLLRTGKLTSDFSLLGLIREMRKQRIAMVQTKEQYVLVHQAVRELFKEQLCMIDSHPYENVDTNGLLIIKEEENTYDCIEYNSNNYLEEKRDNKEKEMVPPPLPSKKNISKFPSKYEKEVENLTAQQRSMNYMSTIKSFVPLGHANDKKKFNNNKEYDNNFEKINKKVPDTQPKLDNNKPIPSKGILRVPQLETVTQKCTTSVKRSKSLKVVSNCDKNALSFCQSSPTENKRRSSLESNFDEHNLDSDCNNSRKPRTEVDPLTLDQKKKNVSQLVSKYDIIKNQDHRTFIRSLTSLDMRQKLLYNNSNLILSPFEDNVAKQKCRLLRSNTQINVLKRNHTSFSQLKNSPHPASSFDSVSNLKVESHNNHFLHNKVNHNTTSLENLVDQNLKIRPKPIGSSTPSTKHQNIMKSSSGKDLHLKSVDRSKNPAYQKIGIAPHLKDVVRSRGNVGKPDHSNNFRYEELYDRYPSDKGAKLNSKPDRFSAYGLKTLQSNSKGESCEPSSSSYDSSKYMRSSQLKLLKSPKKIQLNKVPVHQQKQDSSLSLHSNSKSTYNGIRPYQEDLMKNRLLNSGHEEFPSNSNHLNEDFSIFSDHKPNPPCSDNFVVDETNDIEQSSWVERDRIQANFSKPPFTTGYAMARSRGQTLLNKQDDTHDILRRLENEVDSSRSKGMHVMVDHYEEMNNDHDLTPYEASFNKESIPVQPNEIKYILQNRRNVHQYNASVHTSRHKNVPPPNVCPDVSSSHVSRTMKTAVGQQRSIEVPSFPQDNAYFSSDIHRNYRDSDCFHSAPGVDLDQVAASITKDDENLMKVTLEELQVRKIKSQMAPKDRGPHKCGPPNLGSSSDKKKQQQYL